MVDYIITVIPEKPRFTHGELDRISSILSDIAQVIFATVIVPFVFQIDSMPSSSVVLGLEVSVFCWLASLWFARKASLN